MSGVLNRYMACFSLASEQALQSRMGRRKSGKKEDGGEWRGEIYFSALPAVVRLFQPDPVHRLEYFST